MKIVVATDQVCIHGGIEKVTIAKANFLSEVPNLVIYIVTSDQGNLPAKYPLSSKVKIIDCGVNYNRSKSILSFENLKKAFKHFRMQKKILKNIRPDFIIHPNMNVDYFWLPYIKRKAKLIREVHSSKQFSAINNKKFSLAATLRKNVNKWADSKFDQIIVLNNDEKNHFDHQNVVVIPNPVITTAFKADVTSNLVVAAGRIAPVKGFDQLINAWSIIRKDFPEWQLHIYGEDYVDTQSDLQAQINQSGLQNCIKFMGTVNNLPDTLRNYSIYAMTSQTECFPMVLLEALSVGLPIVTYNCPTGPRHIVTDNSDGFVTPYKDVNGFAEKLSELMSDESLRIKMGINGQLNVQRFNIQNIGQQWIDLFCRLKS